jgi:hypothetical protein
VAKIDNLSLSAAELLFAADLMPGCDDVLPALLMRSDRTMWYCTRFAGHEQYWLDHRSEDGTLW